MTAGFWLGQNVCRANARPITTKNSMEPKLLATTKIVIERTWVSQMWSAVPWILRVSMVWRRGR
ncbi:hypothetical protein D9M71_779340 [compost metagenome]